MKAETGFRRNYVIPFLVELKNTSYFPIQQAAISGDADFILCSRGHFVWLELKDDGQPLRPLQKYKAEWVTKTGGTAIRADISNWKVVKSKLLRFDEGDDCL